jgi:RNA polymerase sigma factor (sigma-70 family)
MQVNGFRDLVRKAQAGEPQALDDLFHDLLPYVQRVASAQGTVPGESVSDRVGDVCQRVLEKLAQFRGAHEAPDDEQAKALFLGWVRLIVRTVTLNTRRNGGEPQPHVSLQGPGADGSSGPGGIDPPARERTPSSIVGADELVRRLLAALDELPDAGDREIVRLRYFEGLSLHQVAERTKLSYDKVRERYHVSMRRLQRRLEGLQ